MNILPPHRPEESAAVTAQLIASLGITASVVVVAKRGYFRDSMGVPGRNDRGMYDDAIIIHSPTAHATFNANTDPSVFRQGIAVLKPGVWLYQPGIHGLSHPPGPRRYPAFVQAGEVTVVRDGGREETGFFGINIHHGGENGTSSLGCQTIFPAQWESFHALLLGELAKHGQHTFPYVLVEQQG